MPAALLPFLAKGALSAGAFAGKNALAIGALGTTAGVVHQGVSQEQARQVADSQAGKDASAREAMLKKEREKEALDAANAANAALRSAARRGINAPTRGGTVLTTPLGVPPAAKTILGG